MLVLQVEVAELVEHQQILALAIVGGADQRDVALSCGDPRQRDPCGIDAGGFLTHEGARRSGHAMDDSDVAGQKVGELRQKQRRAQIVHQPFVEEAGRGVSLSLGIQNRAVDGEITLAATGGDDHVHLRQDLAVALDAGRVERKACGIGADALPRFHLALVTLLRDLRVKGHRHHGMDDVGRKPGLVDIDAALAQRIPMRVRSEAERRRNSDARDPGFAMRRMG